MLNFDELNKLTATSISLAENLSTSERVKRVTDDILSLLILAYMDGLQSAGDMLGFTADTNVSAMQNAIYQNIAGKTFADRVKTHVESGDSNALQVLSETESNRVFNRAVYDAGKQYEGLYDTPTYKTWRTLEDDKVRDTHSYIDNMSVELDDDFVTYDGDSAAYPGGFSNAANNVNCRCYIELSTLP